MRTHAHRIRVGGRAGDRRLTIPWLESDAALVVAKVLSALVVPLAGPAAHAAVFVLLVLWALGGPRRAVEALTLSWLLTFLNPGLYVIGGSAGMLRWLVLCAAFVSAVFCTLRDRRSDLPTPITWVSAFGLITAVTALTASYAPIVSLFKLVTFVIGVTTVILIFHLAERDCAYFRTWFIGFFGVVVFMGFPLIVHDIGYVQNGRGFQGLVNHSQAYGVFIAPLLAWSVTSLACGRSGSRGLWLLLAVGLVSLFATQARTAVVAFGGALALVIVVGFLRRPDLVMRFFERLFQPPILLATIAAVLLLFTVYNQLIESTIGFIFKAYDAHDLGDAFEQSRGFLVDASLRNFRAHPWMGIGFGLASDPAELQVNVDPLLGLPVGAPIEKGFAPSAALEEVGLIGSTLFLILLASILRPMLQRTTTAPELALSLAALLVNIGEAIIFSFGGTGLLMWLLLGYGWMASRQAVQAAALGKERIAGRIGRPDTRRGSLGSLRRGSARK